MKLSGLKNFILESKYLRQKAESLYGLVPFYLGRGRAFPPLTATFLLTYRCNCRCQMCFYYNPEERESTLRYIGEREAEKLEANKIIAIIDDLAGNGVQVLSLHGGEPLLHPSFIPAASRAVSRGMAVRVITNGALLTPDMADRIIGAGIEAVTFSIDGMQQTHDSIRGEGTFNKMIKGVETLLAKREETGSELPYMNAGTYLTALNVDELPEIVKLVRDLGFEDMSVGLVSHCSRGAVGRSRALIRENNIDTSDDAGGLILPERLLDYDPGSLLQAIRGACRLAGELGMKLSVPVEESLTYALDHSFNESSRCMWPWTRVTISPYGEVFPCVNMGTLGVILGDLTEKRFKSIWNGPAARSFRKMMKKHRTLPVCSKCCAINPGKICS